MAYVFLLFTFLAAGAFFWGLVHPKSLSTFAHKPMSRKEALLGSLGLFVVFFVLTGVTAPKNQTGAKGPGTTTQAAIDKPAASQPLAPQPEIKTVTETEPVAFESRTVNDPAVAKGVSSITTAGVAGVRTKTYQVTVLEGKETDKKLLTNEVTTQPVTQVTTVGTKVAAPPPPPSNCDPNYSGKCVPIASDVDCAGGSGNGPAYTSGPVKVIGSDIYGLDRDGDGWGCE